MFIKSIRFRIIFWYVIILTLTLSVFSFALYHYLNRRLSGDIDDLLLTRAEGIIDSIDTYWATQGFEQESAGKSAEDIEKTNRSKFIKIAQSWILEKTTDPILLNIIVHVFSKNGEHIVSSKNMPNNPSLGEEIFNSVLKGNSRFDNLPVEIIRGKHTTLRTLTVPVTVNNKVVYIIQIASPLTSLFSTFKNLKLILFLLLPISIVFSGMMGALLAKLSLNPVNRIMDTMHQIRAENLKLRITIPEAKDEIRRLAETFNEMLDRLEKTFLSQRQFIEDLAHELKTPLSVLKGELEVTLKKLRTPREYESTLSSSLEEANKIIKIVEDLLMLAWYDSNMVPFEMTPLDIGRLFRGVLDAVKILAEQKDIDLHLSSQGKAVVFGDADKLKRLFLNILDNAMKYTPSGGKVFVKISEENNQTKIIISDTGIGIPKDELPHIFERFYRINKARTRDSFGLGLSIVKSIVEAHKGIIEVESELDKGTTFKISLPSFPRP
jgi:two-component system OmpR family sensor kinase